MPGRSDAPDGVTLVKLSANESPLGTSPKAIEAYRAMADKMFLYPEGSSRLLREALGEVHGLDPARIVCGFGSDDMLHLLAQIYLGEGDEGVMSQYGFNVYPIITRGASANVVVAPETDYRASVDAILAAVTDAHEGGVPRQPEQPDRHLSQRCDELQRLHAGLRPQHPARDRQRLCGICDGRRLQRRHRPGRCGRERRDGAHLLEDGHCRRARGLDVWAGACGRCGAPLAWAVQRVAVRTGRGGGRGARYGVHGASFARTMRAGATG